MQSLAIHPALWQLLRWQAWGKVRKLRASFSSPRRQILSLLAIGLTLIWLGNAIASVLLRDAYDPATFQRWMSRGLLLYFGWHVIRVAYSRPEAPLEWTPAEQALLCGGPFSRRELLTYRLMGIFSATLPKAILVTFMLYPDLPLFASGFCGLLLGLVFLEYLRLVLETLACGMSARQYLVLRLGVFGALVTLMGYGLAQAVTLVELRAGNHGPFLRAWAGALAAVNDTWAGQMIEAPFRLIAQVILAPQVSLSLMTHLAGAVLTVAATAHFSIRLDDGFYRKRREAGADDLEVQNREQAASADAAWPRIRRFSGVGTIAWRQLNFAKEHWGSFGVALGFPALLASLPLLAPGEGMATFLTVLLGVVFYSFVLLPAALKLDFRRDFDHLSLLKSLPLSPSAVVVGQLVMPVVLTWAFQIVLLTFAAMICQISWDLVAGAILLLLPINVFVTALDNLIFLLYPHRLHQEGLEVFLRTTLTFTGKGMLLAAALFGVMAWLRFSQWITVTWGLAEHFRLIFLAGISGFAGLAAAALVRTSVWVFARLDPTEV